jgi:hypothetical protein
MRLIPNITLTLMNAISAGGIFYMLHYDMIPKAHKDRKWLPTFGAVFGIYHRICYSEISWWIERKN